MKSQKLAVFIVAAVFAFSTQVGAQHEDHDVAPAAADLKVLVFSGTGWYRHPDIPKINRWLVLIGHEHGFEVDVSETPADLRQRSVLVCAFDEPYRG